MVSDKLSCRNFASEGLEALAVRGCFGRLLPWWHLELNICSIDILSTSTRPEEEKLGLNPSGAKCCFVCYNMLFCVLQTVMHETPTYTISQTCGGIHLHIFMSAFNCIKKYT